MDVRYQIGKSVDSITAEISEAIRKVRAADPDVDAEVTARYQGTKSLAWYISPAHPLVQAARDSFKTVTGTEARVVTKPWWADAGALVNEGKIPTLVMGPTGEPIYTSNESADIEGDLLRGTRTLGLLATEVCASGRDEFETRYGRL
jgi:acetylornithine deacetylase/succinyl-diaminopimelate desuccinylase-like protein